MRRFAFSLLSIAVAACAATQNDSAPRPVAPTSEAPVAVSRPKPDAPRDPEAIPAPAAVAPRRFVEPIAPRSETRAIVLLYHSFGGSLDGRLTTKRSNLEQHLERLADFHVEIVSTSELIDFLDGKIDLPARVAVITIDDGFQSVYQAAWPVFRAHKTRFTVGLVTGLIENPKNAPVMTWDEVREMADSGLCEVASHGHMHRALAAFSGHLMTDEIELSRDLIRDHLGRPPVAYFYPLGSFNLRAARALSKAGYRAAFRATGAPIAAGFGSKWWLPRMGVFHEDPPEIFGHWFSAGFLHRVSYVAKKDPAHKPSG